MTDIRSVLESYKKHHRLTNYLSTAMLYLKDNFLLEEELKPEHLKTRVLGHWGTVPGLNFVYGGLNFIAKKYDKKMLFIAGPGHGAPAVLSNVFVEGTLGTFYPEYQVNKNGFGNLIKDFSWPTKFASHATPKVPGSIHEGGELGYSLGIAYGSVLDQPDLTTVVVVGDGEAETATLAASWQSNKFINPQKDGTVLPILHLNGYKISGPTVFSSMSDGEILCYFKGLGYHPLIVDQYESVDIYIDLLEALITSFQKIDSIKSKWAAYDTNKPEWPVIILRTKKGWSGPVEFGGKKIEDNNLSHGIPLKNPAKNKEEFEALKTWLESYKISEIVKDYLIDPSIIDLLPSDEYKIGLNKYAYGGSDEITLPRISDHEVRIFERGKRAESRMVEMSKYLREIFRANKNNFRVFSPDESESNLLEEVFDTTSRVYIWPLRPQDEFFSKDGKVMEILSENVLFAWMQGYTMTGGNALLISYEAFLSVISSQVDQYIKYLKQAREVKFRKPIPSLNLVSTSTLWRQEHNGFTHQNPTLINSLLTKHSDLTSVYFPIDTNSLITVLDKTLRDKNKVNLIVACKRDIPQWLNMDEAKELLEKGYLQLGWAGTDTAESDVTLVSAGDYQTSETLAAIKILKEKAPDMKIQYVNVLQLNPGGIGSENNLLDSDIKFTEAFGNNEVIFNFHGYPEVIKQLTWGFEISKRMKVLGYIENGDTTTPFDMQVVNHTSRFDICIEAIRSAAKVNESVAKEADVLIKYFEDKLEEHKRYIVENSEDLPEVK